jgi:hypothetical protein
MKGSIEAMAKHMYLAKKGIEDYSGIKPNWETEDEDYKFPFRNFAESILNLPAKCTECKGFKWVAYNTNTISRSDSKPCPNCHGTGLDPEKKLLAVLAEDQSLPEFNAGRGVDTWIAVERTIHTKLGKAMTTPKDGYVWMKVRVE